MAQRLSHLKMRDTDKKSAQCAPAGKSVAKASVAGGCRHRLFGCLDITRRAGTVTAGKAKPVAETLDHRVFE